MRSRSWLMKMVVMATVSMTLVACNDEDKDLVAGPGVGSASIRFIHAGFDAPGVDVLVDNVVGVDALTYGQSSGYTKIAAGARSIKIVPAGAITPILTETDLDAFEGTDYTVVAVGVLDSLAVIYDDDVRTPVTDKAKVRFVHAVPDAPMVDLKLNNGSGPALFTGQSFKDISGYQQIDGGTYAFAVTASGSATADGLYNPIILQDGIVYTIVLHGTLDLADAYPLAVRVFVDNGAGDSFADLAPQSQFANLRVIHAGYDAPEIDMLVDDATMAAYSNIAYRASSGYVELESGLHDIKLVQTGTSSPVLAGTDLTLIPNTDYTVLAVDELAQITAVVGVDSRTPDPAMAKVRFVHASPDAPAIDLKVNTGSGTALFGNKEFKSISGYGTFPGGSYTFVVTAANTTVPLAEFETLLLAAGSVYTVVAHGTLTPDDAYPFGIRVFEDNGAGDQYVDLVPKVAKVRVIHASYDAPGLNVVVDDAIPVAISNLAYTGSSGYTELEPGTRNIKMVQFGTTSPAKVEIDQAWLPNTDYTLLALNEWAAIEGVLVTDLRAPLPTQVKLRFVHAVPDAPPVDIRFGSGTGLAIFGDRSFKTISAYSAVTGGSYTFVVTAANDTNVVVKFEPVTLAPGTVYSVVAHGTLDTTDAYPFSMRMFIDNDAGDAFLDLVPLPPMAKVRVIHAGYDAPNFDVLFDDVTPAAIANLAYRASSGYTEVPAGDRNVKVVEAGTTSPPLIDTNLFLAVNTDNTIFAMDQVASFVAIEVADVREPVPTQAKIRFAHAAPDAPSVDIKLNSGSGPAVFTNRGFTSTSIYTAVLNGAYTFAITATGDTAEVVRFEPVTLNANTVYTIVALGTIDSTDAYPFGVRLFVDNVLGDAFVDLIPQTTVLSEGSMGSPEFGERQRR